MAASPTIVASDPVTVPGFAGKIAAKVITDNSDNGDNQIVTGKCRLDSILINAAIGGVMTIWDSSTTSTGTMIYRFSGSAAGTTTPYLGIPCANGILINQSTGPSTLTIVYTMA